jgi:hypothetical protein
LERLKEGVLFKASVLKYLFGVWEVSDVDKFFSLWTEKTIVTNTDCHL